MPRRNPPGRARRRGAPPAPPTGVMVAHAGPVKPEDCEHPEGRRDIKNRGLCMACGTAGLPEPPRRRGRAG